MTKEETEERANLIAAAPELLSTLKEVEEMRRQNYEIPIWLLVKIQKAIAKATGKDEQSLNHHSS